MAKIALLLTVVLLTGLVAPALARAEASEDYGGVPPIAVAFVLTNGPQISCYDMNARVSSTGTLRLAGRAYMVNNQLLTQGQAVVGYGYLNGDQIVWGFEAFPTAAAQVAAKVGGTVSVATLLGNGFGYHLLFNQIFSFAFAVRLVLATCQGTL